MDNSIYTLNKLVQQLKSDIEAYSAALRYHTITAPKEVLDYALYRGFPEDIYSQYLSEYYAQNEAAANIIINYIDKDFIPYLENVSIHLQEAINQGPGSSAANSVLANPLPSKASGLSEKEQQTIDKNHKDLEKVLGIKQRAPMTIAEADKQNANPHFEEEYLDDPNGNYRNTITGVRCKKNPKYDEQYHINCATCATAYALRLMGFDVKAKGNVIGSGSLNEKISNANEYKNVWKNIDGSQVEPLHTDDWMNKNGIKTMGVNDYRNYFEETCKEKGVYVVMVRWNGDSSGHATILQRDKDGILYYIEPQRYEGSRSKDGRRNLDDLLLTSNGKLRLSSRPSHGYGVLRVDNKLFNVDYAKLFETN